MHLRGPAQRRVRETRCGMVFMCSQHALLPNGSTAKDSPAGWPANPRTASAAMSTVGSLMSIRATLAWPQRTHKWNGVSRALDGRSTFTPGTSRSAWTMSSRPLHAAQCRAVIPSLSLALTVSAAPEARSSRTTATCPSCAARCSAVQPSRLLGWCTGSWRASSSRTTSVLPSSAATLRAE